MKLLEWWTQHKYSLRSELLVSKMDVSRTKIRLDISFLRHLIPNGGSNREENESLKRKNGSRTWTKRETHVHVSLCVRRTHTNMWCQGCTSRCSRKESKQNGPLLHPRDGQDFLFLKQGAMQPATRATKRNKINTIPSVPIYSSWLWTKTTTSKSEWRE